MFIRSIRVDRYGAVKDKLLSLDRQLVVVYGPNEAGKSSVLGFIRAALFGFPARNALETNREPWGGVLKLADESGAEWLIDRRESASSASRARSGRNGTVTVVSRDGTQGGGELLLPLVGGISGAQFHSVFAFSLSELQELRTLQSDELNALLYSVGLGTDGRAVLAAEKKIAQEMDELYRPRGKNQRMAAVLKSFEAVESELRESREQQGRYDAMAAELAELDRRVEDGTGQLRGHRSELAWLEAAEQAAAHLLQSRAAQAELAQLPEPPSAPAAGALPRFERLAEQLERAQTEAVRLEAAVSGAVERLSGLPPEEEALTLRSGMEPLAESLAGFEQDRDSLAALEREAIHLEGQLEALLRQIGEQWTPTELDAFPPTVPAREQIRHFRDRLDLLRAEKDKYSAVLEQYEQTHRESLERSTRIWRELALRSSEIGVEVDDEASSASSLRSMQEMIALFRRSSFNDELPALRRLVRQREQWKLERRLSGSRTEEAALQSRGRAKRTVQTASALPTALWVSAAASIFGGLLWLVPALQLGSRMLAFAGLAGFLLTAAILMITGFRTASYNRPVSGQLDGQSAWDRMLEETDRQLQQMWESFSALPEAAAIRAEAIFQAKPGAGLDPPQSPDDLTDDGLERLERYALQWQDSIRMVEQRFNEWESVVQIRERNNRLTDQENEKLDNVRIRLQQTEQEWKEWLDNLRLSTALSPDTALDIVHRVEQGGQQLYALRTVYAKRGEVGGRLKQYRQAVEQFLGPAAAGDPSAAVKVWLRDCRAAEERALLRRQIVREKEDAERKLQQVRMELEQLSEAVQTLWSALGANDEASFRQIVTGEERRLKLMEEQERAQSLVTAVLGSREREAELDALLGTGGSFALRAMIEERREVIELQERELDAFKDLRSRLAGELEKLEQGAAHADRLQRREEHRAQLAELTGEWAVLSLAAALIRRTRQLVERERQPALLKRATAYFREMTGGRFIRVMMPLGEERLVAERETGELIDSQFMSRGTAEQLYLAMRFALADEVSRAGKVVLPMVMDDVFVNFDRERLGHTLRVLSDVADNRQVLYFTCHPHVVDAFRRSEQPFQLIEM